MTKLRDKLSFESPHEAAVVATEDVEEVHGGEASEAVVESGSHPTEEDETQTQSTSK